MMRYEEDDYGSELADLVQSPDTQMAVELALGTPDTRPLRFTDDETDEEEDEWNFSNMRRKFGQVPGGWRRMGQGRGRTGGLFARLFATPLQTAVVFLVATLVVVGIGMAVTSTTTDDDMNTDEAWRTDWRLPDTLTPSLYELTIHIDVPNFVFNGTVHIHLHVEQDTDVVVLHAADLDLPLHEARVNGNPIQQLEHIPSRELIAIHPATPLTQGQDVVLTLAFAGHLKDDLKGLYRSHYVTHDANGQAQARWMAITQMEATDARRAFPCWDEPAYKAEFDITIIAPKDYTAVLSNMPAIDTQMRTNHQIVHFQKSVRMSTYLVALMAAPDFVFHETTTPNGNVQVRVWAAPDKVTQLDAAVDAAAEILGYYETLFGLPFPLPKCDLIAVADFAAGAMENWGLITFRETALLVDPTASSEANRERVVVVVAHELAHQYFGNYVTMDWWNALWLNEGFASYVEFLGTAHVRPQWNYWGEFFAGAQSAALVADASAHSHPLLQTVGSPAQINEMFDFVSYSKGASIIRMIAGMLGDHAFQEGLRLYIRTHKFGNARVEDLWHALTQASHDEAASGNGDRNAVDVGAVMGAWTEQMGYPLLHVTLVEPDPIRGRNRGVLVRQTRFLQSPVATPDTHSKWDVPISHKTSMGGADATHTWLRAADADLFLEWDYRAPGVPWIKLNIDNTALVRVQYPPLVYRRLEEKLHGSVFSDGDKQGILSDAFALARAEAIDYDQALNLTRFLVGEQSYHTWDTALGQLASLEPRIRNHLPGWTNLFAYMIHLLTPLYNTLGWTVAMDESHLQRELHSLIASSAVAYGVVGAREQGKTLFDAFHADPQGGAVPATLRAAVYRAGIEQADIASRAEFDFLYARYQETVVAAEARLCLWALSHTKNQDLLQELLDATLEEGGIRAQDGSRVILYVSRNKEGEATAWNFVRDRWDDLFARYGGSSFSFGRLLSGVIAHFDTVDRWHEARAFFSTRDLGSGTRAVQQGLEVVEANIRWAAQSEPAVVAWLLRENNAMML